MDYAPIETVHYWGGPWDGKVAPLNDCPKPFLLADIEDHIYRCVYGRMADGSLVYSWGQRCGLDDERAKP